MQRPCQIARLEFRRDTVKPQYRRLEFSELSSELSQDNMKMGYETLGQMIVIEDLSPDVVEELGSHLSIDPMFFASHINAAYCDIEWQTPDFATLPSRRLYNNFVNIQYHRAIVLQKEPDLSIKLLRDMNIGRKIVILPPIRSICIALVQHGCSVLRDTRKGGSWLCTDKTLPFNDATLLLETDTHRRSSPCGRAHRRKPDIRQKPRRRTDSL